MSLIYQNVLLLHAQGKDGKGKKNKQEDIELFELPRTQSTLGSCQVPLASLLEGEPEVEAECVCTCEGGEETGDSDKKEGGPGAKSDASDKKKANKGQFLIQLRSNLCVQPPRLSDYFPKH